MATETATDDSNAQNHQSDAQEAARPPAARTLDQEVDRRTFMKGVGAAAAIAAVGTGSAAAAETGEVAAEDVNFASNYVHNPYLTGSITVETHKKDFSQLDYVADDESTTNLSEHGIVLAEQADADTPHNPVTLEARYFETPEYKAFPRGTTYDDDADTATEEIAVEWHDKTHWTTTNATNGTITLTNGETDSLEISTSSVAAGETVKATFDLSTVGSTDATITEGMSRKFLQLVEDTDALPAGSSIVFAIIDSAGKEVTAEITAGGDTSLVDVLGASTQTSRASQVRVGDLESDQAVTLDDIQKFEIRVKEASAGLTIHGLNLERAEEWVYGTEEYTNSDGDVDTQDVTTPAGAFSIRNLSTIPAPLDSAEIRNVKYDVELRASELPNDQVWAQVNETPSTYDRPNEFELVAEFEWPTAYALDVTADKAMDEVELPNSRILEGSAATGIADIDEWKDIEESISWTDKTGSYGAVGTDVTLLTGLSSADRTSARTRVVLSDDELADATSGSSSSSGSGTGVVAVGGGSGFNWIPTAIIGGVAGVVFFLRNSIKSLLGM